jgi:hypothetical protein
MNQARRVAQHPIAVPQRAWRGLPSFGHPRRQQFIRVRTMIPDGDRRDFTESGRAEDQNESVAIGCKYIVRIFIVRDCLDEAGWRGLPTAPRHELLERAENRQLGFQRRQHFP